MRESVPKQKISTGFSERLAVLKKDEMVQAVVMLETGLLSEKSRSGRGPDDRKRAVRVVRERSGPLLDEIDSILKIHGGRRLSADINALASVALETTPSGIQALITSPAVKTILEDQPIFLAGISNLQRS